MRYEISYTLYRNLTKNSSCVLWKTGDDSEFLLFSALIISRYVHSVLIFIFETNCALGHGMMCPWIRFGKEIWTVDVFYS
jgi:hypothetical protein